MIESRRSVEDFDFMELVLKFCTPFHRPRQGTLGAIA